jgi:hypothetical protein
MKTSWLPFRLLRIARIVAPTAAILIGLSAMPAMAAPAAASYYVDCSAASNGNGTQARPWNATSAVNSRTTGFTAGEKILFKAGSTCTGQLTPRGSGRSGSPITLGAYGQGAKPVVAAAANQQSALTLRDQSWWTVTGLDFKGGTRQGVFVTVTAGVVRGITLSNLTVHDVTGGTLDSKDTGLVVVSPTHDTGNSTSARFDQVLVDGVTAHDTTMWAGIIVGTGTNADSWAADESKRSTNVTVRNSTVYNTYGDGVILFAVDKGLLEHNVAHDTGIQPTQTIGTPNAIWTWACNGCTVQYNEAYHNDSPGADGGAFDIDTFSRNTTVQYNYGHDNSSYCVAVFSAGSYVTTNSVIRYNVCAHNGTQNGGSREEICFAVWSEGSIDGVLIYGNTLVTSHGAIGAYNYNYAQALFTGSLPRVFANNIVYATTANPYGPGDPDVPGAVLPGDYNDWYSTVGPWSNGEAHSVYADPKLVDAAHSGTGDPGNAYDLRATSPAINSGTAVADSGGHDFRGNPVPRGGAFDMGAVESPY